MNTKNNLIALMLLLCIVVTACKNNKAVNTESKTETVDIHNSQNALDWAGSYFGVLPCASCPGINTLITLGKDGTFEKTLEYLESSGETKTTKGKFQWNTDNTIITIEAKGYRVGENQLIALDQSNKIIEGELADNYILSKTELEMSPDTNDGYILQTFGGDDGKTYNIIFNTNPRTPTALVQSDGMQTMLSQTQAWAKGAEYSGSKMQLKAQGDKATLIISGIKIELSEK